MQMVFLTQRRGDAEAMYEVFFLGWPSDTIQKKSPRLRVSA